MGIIPLELTNISFQQKSKDWNEPLDIDLTDSNSCVILVGINAGGKSLTLKAIDKFTSLLSDPLPIEARRF